MEIIATKENLLFGVNAVQKAVSTKSTLPILSCIKLEAKEDRIYFSATDLETGIVCFLPVQVIREGVTVVPANYFSEIVRKLPNTNITLKQAGENDLLICYEDSELTLKTLAAHDFPHIPELSGDFEIHLKTSVLKQMIKQTVFAAGTDEGRPLFTGILCECQGDKIRLVATDTHRLALRQGEIQSNFSEQKNFIIPAKMMAELARLMYEDEICYIGVTKNLSSFKFSNIRIICRLLEGQFPNYRQVIPSLSESKIKTQAKRLQEAVERISLFSIINDKNYTVNFKIIDNYIVISSQSELGYGYEKISIDLEGEPLSISFNAKYLSDVFKILDSEMITMEFTGPLSPCIIRPSESDNFVYLLLPVRT